MENKCLFDTRPESFCSETTSRLTKLSECRSYIDDQLRRWHLSQHIGSVQEHELILNRSGLPHYLASKQLERLWICAKHRHDMGKNWRPCRTCMPLTVASWPEEGTQDKKYREIVMSSERTKLDSTATFCNKYSIEAFFQS